MRPFRAGAGRVDTTLFSRGGFAEAFACCFEGGLCPHAVLAGIAARKENDDTMYSIGRLKSSSFWLFIRFTN